MWYDLLRSTNIIVVADYQRFRSKSFQLNPSKPANGGAPKIYPEVIQNGRIWTPATPGRDFSEEMFHFCEKFSRILFEVHAICIFCRSITSASGTKWESLRLLSLRLGLLLIILNELLKQNAPQSWIHGSWRFLSKKIHLRNISKYYFESDQIYALCMDVYMHACNYIHIYIHANNITTTTTTPTFPPRSTSSSFPKKKTKCVETPEEIAFLPQSCFPQMHDMKDGGGGVGQPQVPYCSSWKPS